MSDHERLEQLLDRIDGRQYGAYRDLKGRWRLGGITLFVDHVQGDPFAAPTRVRLRTASDLDPGMHRDSDQRLAAEDWLLRRFGEGLFGASRGSGKSGRLYCYRPGPEVVERSGVRLLRDGDVEVRFSMGLPARGRRILGRQAWEMLTHDVPRAARRLEPDPSLEVQVRSVVAQRTLRRQLRDRGLVAFVADGAILPRASGIDPQPMANAVPFESPPSMRVTLETPSGEVSGMGLQGGTTLVVGGGFHGKSTLLQAIQ
ncbi:MAG: ATPase, partial [Deltaproteobacteria bacterium]|nr:ATPase [Deltaproteobacteria bacterium]